MSVPKLRFPEFRDAGEWEVAMIGDFVDSYKGGAPLTPSDFIIHSNYEVIPKKAIIEGGWLKLDVNQPTYCKESFYKENLKSVVDSTYLITTLRDLVPSGPSIGYIVKFEGNKNYILAQGVYGLKLNQAIIPEFLIHFSNTQKYRKIMQSLMVGSTQVHIRNNVFLNLIINIPSLPEQQKIADCLTSLADRITAETQKLDTLKAHKKGLMQQLFPAEGETLPKLRFPEFQDAGEWEEKKLGEVLTIGNGKDYKHLSKGDVPVYGTGGYMLSVDDYLYDGESVCIGRKGTIDKPVLLSGKFWTVDTLFYTHSFKNCLPKFIYLRFQCINWLDYNAASGVPSLSKSTIENIALAIPLIPEQQKIADCLTSIDEAIAAQSQAIDLLKLHKKGLMQQLFPSVEEVRG